MRKWAPIGAALVVLVVLAGAALLTRTDAPTEPGREAAAPAGWRLVSYRDVVVEVPESWGWGEAPGPDWCAGSGDSFPQAPYVDVSRGTDAVLSIGCMQDMPERYDVTHLEFSDAGSAADPATEEGPDFFSTTRQVGAAVVTVWSDAEHEDLARQIVDSARVVATDPSGCSVSSPVQAGGFARPPRPFRVEDIPSVDTISICQYDIGGGVGVPGLLASYRLTGPPANEVLGAIQAAPVGGGPDAPQQCTADSFGDMALVLRLASAGTVRDLYVYVQSCRGNGFDDGTTLRELTPEACRPLFELPVRMTWGHEPSFTRCHG